MAVTKPPVFMLAPVTLPLTLNKPVTYSPVVANTTTLAVPPTVIAMLPLATGAAMFEVPDVIGNPALVALTPVSCEPLPKK